MQFANKVSKITLKVVSKEIISGEIPNCTISSTFLVPLCPTILTDANQFCKIFDTNLKCITSILSNFGLYNSKLSFLLLYIYKVSVLVVFKQLVVQPNFDITNDIVRPLLFTFVYVFFLLLPSENLESM